jgi:hypothetical protein
VPRRAGTAQYFRRYGHLTYIGNSTSNKGINLGGVVTLSGGGYCHATFRVKDGRVVEVHYSGETNATLAPDAYCAPIVTAAFTSPSARKQCLRGVNEELISGLDHLRHERRL